MKSNSAFKQIDKLLGMENVILLICIVYELFKYLIFLIYFNFLMDVIMSTLFQENQLNFKNKSLI